jgi:hypothetical protein
LLPVELINFTGWHNAEQGVNYLQWITLTELNTAYFDVEKRTEYDVFSNIGTVDAAGNSLSMLSYAFIDDGPAYGNNYYRLKMTDQDGSFSYSNIINIPVQAMQSADFTIYPNPVSNTMELNVYSVADCNASISITDMLGRSVLVQHLTFLKGNTHYILNTQGLAAGAYTITLVQHASGTSTAKQFIKLN